jgi:ribonuclease BN (tRNA processing enzyme)
MSRIIFLGTAGSSAVVTKQLRGSGGIILQIEDLQFHIDPGPGSLIKAKEFGINLHHTTAVIISHKHINHCNDLNVIIDAMTHSGIETRGILLGSKSVLLGNDEDYPFLTKYHKSLVEKIIPLEKKHKVGIELLEINALPVDHTDPEALGFKMFCPRFTLSYTGDTAYSDKLVEELKGTDILIMNVPYPGNKGVGKNLDTQAAIKMVSHVRPKLAVITHFGLEMLKEDPLTQAREIQRITGIQTIAAQDGLSISPEGYGEYKGPVRGFE